MEYSVEIARLAGLSPMESLQVVTRNAARLMGLDDTIGTVEAGKEADLLILAENPLDEVGNLTGVLAVLKAGERVA
jgi:imidazolonepropionase-like amidohydrolase